MNITSITIAPTRNWDTLDESNPMRAVVTLRDRKSSVETILSDETMRRLLDLCAVEIAQNAERNVQEFVAAVSAIEAERSAPMVEASA